MPGKRPPLDTVVKLGLGVFIGAFALIWGGMFLTRPDRSIPPFSIGTQEGELVAIHVPVYTSNDGLERLIRRFQKVASESREFGRLKIQPTTPDDPRGRYQRMRVFIFTHEAWAEPEMLRRYVTARGGSSIEDRELSQAFERAVRGYYRLDERNEEGRIGPLLESGSGASVDTPATAAFARELFKGPVGQDASGEAGALEP